MAIFEPKPWVDPLGKNVNFSTFRTFFYSLKKRFLVLEYRKRHFPGVYCLKRKVGKMGIFGLKPWVNPFGRLSIFRLLKLFVFIAWKGVFSFYNYSTFRSFCFYSLERRFFVLEYRKRHFPCPYCLTRKVGLTPLEKCQFFDFLNFLFL